MENRAKLIANDQGFALEGSVSFASVLGLRKEGEGLIHQLSSPECVIDLSKSHNQDATLFSLLLCWIRFAEKKGLKTRLVSAPPTFLRMQHLFGLEKIWINY